MSDHRIELEHYSGPLDLLLWLLRRDEVDIHDIPIASILESYLEMLQAIQVLDLDGAGEFLVMASMLMEIKTRSLLPREEPLEDEELDPRFELVQKLLEYRCFKEVSGELRQRADHWSGRFPPGQAPVSPGLPPDEVPLADVSLWDLAHVFARLMAEVEVKGPKAIVYDDVPIEAHMEDILASLGDRRSLPFGELFPEAADRPRVAGVFLALLELIRRRRVRAVQREPFSPIEIRLREDGGPSGAPAGDPAALR